MLPDTKFYELEIIMNKVALMLVLISGFAVAGEIEIGAPDFESLNPFCH